MNRKAVSRPKGLFASYWQVLIHQRKLARRSIILTVFGGLLETAAILAIVPIVASQEKIDKFGIVLKGPTLRYWAVVGFIVMALLASLVRLLAERSLYRMLGAFERESRIKMTKTVLEMDWSAFLKLRGGDLNTSLLLTIEELSYGVQFFVRAVGMLGIVAVFAGVAVGLSWRLGLFTLGFGALALAAYFVGLRPTQRHSSSLTSAASSLGEQADLLFNNLKLFRSQGGRSASFRRIHDTYDEYAHAYVKSQFTVPLTRALFEMSGIVGVAILLFGALITTRGAVLSGASIAFLVLFLRLAPRLTSGQELLQMARVRRKWCDTWWAMLDGVTNAPMFLGGSSVPSFEKCLEVRDVGFVYPGTTRSILSGINWEIHPGEAIAFVGDSGAGKTTMTDLVTGLIQPCEGTIRLDGTDLRDIDIEAWQSHLGLVMQEPPLLAGSVLENVFWTELTRDLDQARQALEMANALGFVQRLPEGPESVIGQRGATLSGGERQRLALARALYRKPWLLILDEPTSALDAESEEEVLRALEGIKSTCAMIIIAHGLNPVRLADRIYVLDGGRIVEHGTWDELVEQSDGRFRSMVERHSRFS